MKEYDAVKEMVYGIRSDLFDRLVELSKVCQSDYRFDSKDEVADEIDDLIEHSKILGKGEERERIIKLIESFADKYKGWSERLQFNERYFKNDVETLMQGINNHSSAGVSK